jgi:hypothetical protein
VFSPAVAMSPTKNKARNKENTAVKAVILWRQMFLNPSEIR